MFYATLMLCCSEQYIIIYLVRMYCKYLSNVSQIDKMRKNDLLIFSRSSY